MTAESLTLWTVASSEFVRLTRGSGHGVGSWAHVEPRWKPAYRWMCDEMARRGVGIADASHPPIWAWHSCREWCMAPDAETVDMLCGLSPENRVGLSVIEWRAPAEEVLLSSYEGWCDILGTEGLELLGRAEGVDLTGPPAPPSPPAWWREGLHVQATVGSLGWSRIVRVQSLGDYLAAGNAP